MALIEKEILGIQYIHGRLSAEVVYRRKSIRSWECPEPVLDEDPLILLLQTIPKQLQFLGSHVSMIILSPAIDYQSIKIPSKNKKDMLQFLKWKASAMKGDRHIWSYTKLDFVNNERNIYLHLVPETYRMIFLNFCKENDFIPYHLLTVTAVVPNLLQKAISNDNTVEMIAVVTDQTTFLVIGTRNLPILIRAVPYSWNSMGDNIRSQFAREVKRTIIFSQQQLRKQITVLRLFGRNVETIRGEFSDLSDVAIDFIEGDIKWLELVYQTSPYRTDNLLPVDVVDHVARRRRTMGMFIIISAMIIVLASIAIMFTFFNDKLGIMVAKSSVNFDVAALREQKQLLEAKRDEIIQKNRVIENIAAQLLEPVPGWFAGFVGDALPDALTLTRLFAERDDIATCWNVEIEGVCPSNPVRAAELVEKFQNRLTDGPVHFVVTHSFRLQWLENLKTESAESGSVETGQPFRISGMVR